MSEQHAHIARKLHVRTRAQAGNDFLPNVPSLEIYDRPSALDTLLGAYRAVLVAAGNYVTSAGKINPDRLRRLLAKLAEDEEARQCLTPWAGVAGLRVREWGGGRGLGGAPMLDPTPSESVTLVTHQ